jgi:hypothetical protein
VIVPDQKVAAGAFFNAVVHSGENTSVSVGPNGRGGTCRHSDAVEVQNGGLRVKEILRCRLRGASYLWRWVNAELL